jgi:predicted nucleic acid-binding protein
MTFLDSSTIIQYLSGNQKVTNYLDTSNPWWTSTICVFEVLNGKAGSPGFDPMNVRQQFSGVEAIEFSQTLALETARLQHEATQDGDRLSPRDAMIAATARSTGDEFVVADSDFDIQALQDQMNITNLAD